jgi:hypothetical protein
MDIRRNARKECYSCAHKRDIPGNCHIKCVKPDADMTGDLHGIRSGWFFYPRIFDPSWKTAMCKNYELNEQCKSVVNRSVSVAGKPSKSHT